MEDQSNINQHEHMANDYDLSILHSLILAISFLGAGLIISLICLH